MSVFAVTLLAIVALANAGVYYYAPSDYYYDYYYYPDYYYYNYPSAFAYYGQASYQTYYHPVYSNDYINVGIYAGASYPYVFPWYWHEDKPAVEQPAQVTYPLCSDGTPYAACSASEPRYCDNGFLVNKASYCGCPEGMMAQGDACVEAPCEDGTPSDYLGLTPTTNYCSANRPYYCIHRQLVQKSSVCGCPAGYKEDGREGCMPLQDRCFVYLPSAESRAGQNANIMVYFRDLPWVPTAAAVYCGQSGNAVPANCTGSYVDNAWTGQCTAQCNYAGVEKYPAYYYVSADLDGVLCASAKAKVTPPLPTTGVILARAVDDKGAAVANAKINFAGYPGEYYADDRGELLIAGVNPASFTLTFSKTGYANASYTASVSAGQVAVVQAKMQKRNCDIGAQLMVQPSCPAQGPLVYQINLTNYGSSSTYSLSYSGLSFTSDNPNSTLSSGETRVITLNAQVPGDFVGGTFAQVTVNSGNCSTSIALPVCQSTLVVEAMEKERNAWPGTGAKECFKLLVRNYGSDAGIVTMSSNDSDGTFSQERFNIVPNEAKNLEYCTYLKVGATQAKQVKIRASMLAKAQSIEASEVVSLVPFDSSKYGVNVSSCIPVGSTGNTALTIRNNVVGGDYYVSLDGNTSLNTNIVQPNLYNFDKGSERTVYVSFDASGAEGGDYTKSLNLLSEGRVVFQKNICFRVDKTSAIAISLSGTAVVVYKGSSASIDVVVKNIGTKRESITMESKTDAPADISIFPSSFVLRPGEEAKATVSIDASSVGIAGVYNTTIMAKNANRAVLKAASFDLTVRDKSTPFAASIEQKQQGFVSENGSTVFKATFEVKADEDINGKPAITGLPEGWSYSIEPSIAIIRKGETVSFTATIVPKAGASGVYTPSFEISSGERKIAAPFKIDTAQASGLSGFFTVGSSGFIAFVIIALIVLGSWMYFRSRQAEEEFTQAETSETAALAARINSAVAAAEAAGQAEKAAREKPVVKGLLEIEEESDLPDFLEEAESYVDRGRELEEFSSEIEKEGRDFEDFSKQIEKEVPSERGSERGRARRARRGASRKAAKRR